MRQASTRTRDDRVLPYTRAVAVAITPFLLVGGAGLYLFPGSTQRWWAWTIHPTMTPMVLAAAYLGGACFFVRTARTGHWGAVHLGFLPVTAFATLLGVATVVHWDRFSHDHPAFWVWTALYWLAPPLVLAAWLTNRRRATPRGPDELELAVGPRVAVLLVSALALAQGVAMQVSPAAIIPAWPWTLTPLTCRVVGAVFCLGCAGLAVLADARWEPLRLMVQVEVVMVTLMLAAGLRARHELHRDRPLTWLLGGGLTAVLVGSMVLWSTYERRLSRAVAAG